MLYTSITTKTPPITEINLKSLRRIISLIDPAKHILLFCAMIPNIIPAPKESPMAACTLPGPFSLKAKSEGAKRLNKNATVISNGSTYPLSFLIV